MKIRLITIGKTAEKYLMEGINEYSKRIRRFVKFECIELPDVKNGSSFPVKELQLLEAKKLEEYFAKNSGLLFLLDEKGKEFTSSGFAQFITKSMNSGKDINFVIGGAFGFDSAFKEKADGLISMSKMTTTHQLIRLIFTEQLYRAFSIIENLPYHNE